MTIKTAASHISSSAKPLAADGYIIFVDIVSYSKKPADEQFECATFLSQKAQKTKLYRKLETSDDFLHANTTGDGFVLVCGGALVSANPFLLLDFTHDILDVAKAFNQRRGNEKYSLLEIRCGIHKGKFFFHCPAFNEETALGTGVNMAARICGLADAGQIIVSEDFKKDYDNHHAKDELSKGRKFSSIWAARVKHNLTIPVCAYRYMPPSSRSPRWGTKNKPRAQKAHEDVQQLVISQLKFIVTELSSHLETKGIPKETSRLRARLFCPDHESNIIRPTHEFVVKYDNTNPGPSIAQFSILPSHPTGVPGFAYVTKQVIAHTDLPDPLIVGLDNYLATFVQYNLKPEEFKNMLGRQALAFLSLPIECPLLDDSIVLSIDGRHPLYPVNTVETIDLLDRLRRIAQPLLAPAWDLWCKV